MTESNPKTPDTESGPEVLADVVSDPAKGADDRSDWSDEGGATTEGPAEDA